MGFAAFLGLVVCLFSMMEDFGMSWDEQRRWRSGDQKLDYYESLWNSASKWETMQASPNDVYPGLYDIPVALLRRHTDLDPVVLSRGANLFFGLFCVLSCFLLARLSFSTFHHECKEMRRWGPYVAVLLLLTMPEFFGHIFINPKDIPFAATYTFGLWSIGRLIISAPRFRLLDTFVAGLAVGMCMSARPPGVVLLAYAFAAGSLAVFWGVSDRRELKQGFANLFIHGIAMGLVAIGVLFAFWPASHRNPFTSSVEAVERLRTFSETIPVLFEGQMYSAGDTPFYYVVWVFLIKASLPVLVLLGVGFVLSLSWIRHRSAEGVKVDRLLPHHLLLILAVFFPFAYVLVKQPAIHNGFRHMLYVLPPLVVLLAMSWAGLIERITSFRAKLLCWVGLGVVLLVAIVTLVRLHPYQYVYYNVLVGGTHGALNRYETEYWFTSGKEALERLAASPEYKALRASGEVSVMVAGPSDAIDFHVPEGMRIEQDRDKAQFYIGNTQMRTDLLVEGPELFRIERSGLPIVVVKTLQ